MAKVKMYVRVAKDGYKYKLEAGTKENVTPLHKGGGYNSSKEYLPTVAFAVNLDMPDELFSKAAKVIAEINVAMKDVVVAAELPVPAKTKNK